MEVSSRSGRRTGEIGSGQYTRTTESLGLVKRNVVLIENDVKAVRIVWSNLGKRPRNREKWGTVNPSPHFFFPAAVFSRLFLPSYSAPPTGWPLKGSRMYGLRSGSRWKSNMFSSVPAN